jgi:hypothetical protein
VTSFTLLCCMLHTVYILLQLYIVTLAIFIVGFASVNSSLFSHVFVLYKDVYA